MKAGEGKQTCNKKNDTVSVVTISDAVVDRLTNKMPGMNTVKKVDGAEEDQKWYATLKCMDDYHTNRHGLTEDVFNQTLAALEQSMASATHSAPPCHKQVQEVIRCYRGCHNQTLNCEESVRKFADCVDLKKMEAIAQHKQRRHNQFGIDN
ncbi:uncharacterized protein [Periplaneta americana]|uniref:uncharacterized protein n=1 Tax=Periplaneta americana TaxID=6978 RepID=UPI0037E73001